MKIIKIRNDAGNPYPSNQTLWDLIEVSGLPWIDQTEFNIESPGLFIVPVINGNSIAWARDSRRRCKLYAWQLERNLGGYDTFAPSCFDQVWVGDRSHAAALKNQPHVRYVPVGGHPDLGKIGGEKKWDLAACCYTYGRREKILHGIKAKGYSIAPNAFPPERGAILSACRTGLSVHQHSGDSHLNELRAVLFACYRLPLIFEHVKDPYPFLAYDLNDIDAAIRDERGYAEVNYRRMTEEFEFRKVIEDACQ